MARVLIVDDEPTDRIILGNIIEQTGHEVFFASDGEQALKVHLKKSIDVVNGPSDAPGQWIGVHRVVASGASRGGDHRRIRHGAGVSR